MSINQDRPCKCMFFFADDLRCQMPPSADDMGLCYFHAKKHSDHISAQEAGVQINEFLSRDILTACDLSAALSTLFSVAALGLIKPKTTVALTYLSQLMLQTQKLARQEFVQSFDDTWPKIVRESVVFNEPDPEPAQQPQKPATQSTNPILTPQNESSSKDPNPDPTNPSPSPKSCSGVKPKVVTPRSPLPCPNFRHPDRSDLAFSSAPPLARRPRSGATFSPNLPPLSRYKGPWQHFNSTYTDGTLSTLFPLSP